MPYFRWATRLVLFAFGAAIVGLFLADILYIDAASATKTLSSPAVTHALFLSLSCSVVATLLSVSVAIPSGYALSRYPFRGMIVLDVLVDALIVLPVLIIGISILVFFRLSADLPLIGGLFEWLGNLFVHQVPGIVLAMFFCSASYAIRVMKATFDELDPRTEQVAMTLGCTRGQAFWRVSLPLARHGIVAAAVLSWARAVGIYGPVMIVAGAVARKTDVLPTTIYKEISNGELRPALAISVLMIVMAFIVLALLKTFSKSSLFGTGGAE